MKSYIVGLLVVFSIVIIVLFLLYYSPEITTTPDYMIGRWKGKCGVINDWWHYPELAVEIEINADGSVSGFIGDAALKEGKLMKNSWIQEWIWNRSYIIKAGLGGYVVEEEGIKREAVVIFVPVLNQGERHWRFETRSPEIGDSESIRIYSERFIMMRVVEWPEVAFYQSLTYFLHLSQGE
jgi:hypothetical protein